MAARAIKLGEADMMIAGGVEGMTRSPYVMGKPTAPFDRNAELEDTVLGWRFVNPKMKAAYGVDSMGQTAENVAPRHQISRTDQDAFAYRSQRRCGRAGPRLLRQGDRHGRRQEGQGRRSSSTRTSIRAATPRWRRWRKLPAAFREGGSVTAGNSSGINDGACAMIIASEAAAKANGLTPRARILGAAVGRRAAARHGHRPGAGDAEAAGQARHDDRATST